MAFEKPQAYFNTFPLISQASTRPSPYSGFSIDTFIGGPLGPFQPAASLSASPYGADGRTVPSSEALGLEENPAPFRPSSE